MKSFIVTALAAAVVAMPQNGAIPAGMTGVPKFPSWYIHLSISKPF